MLAVLALAILCVAILILCGSIINYAIFVAFIFLMLLRATTPSFSTNSYCVSLSLTLFLLANIAALLQSYHAAHEVGRGVAMSSTHAGAACRAREVQSWEALVATRPACSPSLYEPMQIRGEYELRAPPHLSVRVETAGVENTLVQTCEHAGVVCVHAEILHHAAVPWDAVTTVRMENTGRAYLVHKLNAILTPAYDVSIVLNTTRQIRATSRRIEQLELDSLGRVTGRIPFPSAYEMFILVPNGGAPPRAFVNLHNRCLPDAQSCRTSNNKQVALPARELHNLARTAMRFDFAAVHFIAANCSTDECLLSVPWALVCYALNMIVLLLLALGIYDRCLKNSGKSIARLVVGSLAGASFNWVALGSVMLATTRAPLTRTAALLWSALCVAQIVAVVHAVATASAVAFGNGTGVFAAWSFILFPSCAFHGNIFLVNAVANLTTTGAVLVVLACSWIFSPFL